MIIGGLQKSSLIDYPEKISAIIFTQGCNFRCPYCHNPELINAKCEMQNAKWNKDNLLHFLNSRLGKLDGVVITGGEPTLHKDLPEFIKEIKDLGFCVKLDTNGTNPNMLQKLIDEKLIDYVAMDIKAPLENDSDSKPSINPKSRLGSQTQQQQSSMDLNPNRYEQVVCAKVNSNNIAKSIEIIKNSNIDYEFRTTVVKSQLSGADFEKIGALIKGAKKYYLQKFLPTKLLDENYKSEATYSDNEMLLLAEELKKYVTNVNVR